MFGRGWGGGGGSRAGVWDWCCGLVFWRGKGGGAGGWGLWGGVGGLGGNGGLGVGWEGGGEVERWLVGWLVGVVERSFVGCWGVDGEVVGWCVGGVECGGVWVGGGGGAVVG